MKAQFYLYFHELPGGRVVASPVDFPNLANDADSYDAARAGVIAALRRTLAEDYWSGMVRASFVKPELAELQQVTFELPVKFAKDEKLKITVSVVVALRSTSHGDVFVASVPADRDIEVAVSERNKVDEAIRESLEKQLEHYDLSWLLALDVVGKAWLETVELELPAGSTSSSDTTDSTFDFDDFADDLTGRARRDEVGHLDAREDIVDEFVRLLSSSSPTSVVLVGPPNVGKSAVIDQLARLAAAETGENPLATRQLVRLTATELMANAKYWGMWEGRVKTLVDTAGERKAIVVMGDPLAIISSGRSEKSEHNMARALRPALERGDITAICECTPEAYETAKKLEPSFVRAFQRIDVSEPDPTATLRIAESEVRRISERESVEIEDAAVTTAIHLTSKFLPYLAQPGKSVQLLDSAAREVARADGKRVLGKSELIEQFTRQTGLPSLILSDEATLDTESARSYFEERVLGQAEAVDAMVDLISVVKAGLNDPQRPLGVFFCVGPTGVGKTEITKALAKYLFGSPDRMIRLDMSEYSGPDAVTRLVGSKWNSGDEGELTRRVREQPFSVVLLDELEKADPGVFDVLLSVMGEGRLTDPNGRTADFRNAIIVMTSNLGADKSGKSKIGFSEDGAKNEADQLKAHFIDHAQKFFKPEFYNRIDRVIAFRPLDRDTVRKIARRELGSLLDRQGIVSRQLLVEIDDAVVDAMAEGGFDPKYGARPLHRKIERSVIRPLARLIVEARPGPGDLIRLSMSGDQVSVDLRKVAPAAAEAQARRHERTAAGSKSTSNQLESLRHELEETGGMAESLRNQRSRLIEATNQPSFWDEPEEAKDTLARLYQLERVLERFDRADHRVEGLTELVRNTDQKRDQSRQSEIRKALVEVEDEIALVRLELAGAIAGPEQGEAKLRIVPIGGAADWADELFEMYRSWAANSGRDAEALGERELRIAGLSSYDLLKAEAGLHRRLLNDREFLARVHVVDGDEPATAGDGEVSDEIVRVYSEGSRQFVRDPRTGVNVGDVASVFRGRIDEFLVGEALMSTVD